MMKKLVERDNPIAIYNLAGYYHRGENGFPKDVAKAIELIAKSGELGYNRGYANLGESYRKGDGVAKDEKKAVHYWELAAKMGHIIARHNLGTMELRAGNWERAFKHFAISAKAGVEPSLDVIRDDYKKGLSTGIEVVTKDQYAEALRGYQKSQAELASDSREEWARATKKNSERGV